MLAGQRLHALNGIRRRDVDALRVADAANGGESVWRPIGGGKIDFPDVVKGQGSFYASFPSDQFKQLPELDHLFYVSHAPKKLIDGEEFGLGCGKWVDLKGKFSSLQKVDFLSLNTTHHRHLFVMAGNYVFVFRKLNQIYVTQLTITDSKNTNQLCPQVKGSNL